MEGGVAVVLLAEEFGVGEEVVEGEEVGGVGEREVYVVVL